MVVAILWALSASSVGGGPAVFSTAPTEQRMCSVPCKPKPKKVIKKTPPPPPPPPAPIIINIQQTQTQTQTQVQAPQPPPPAPKPPDPQPQAWRPSWLGIGVRGALGMNTCSPYVFGLVGLRLKSERAHLGLDVGTNFAYGLSASLLVYPYVGEFTSWHLNAGALAFGARTFANASVPRKWDLTLGTGLEFRLPIRWLSITADYRYAVANPWALAKEVPNGLNRDRAWGNALMRSQLMAGLMAHTW